MYKEIMYGVYSKRPRNKVAQFTSKLIAKALTKINELSK